MACLAFFFVGVRERKSNEKNREREERLRHTVAVLVLLQESIVLGE